MKKLMVAAIAAMVGVMTNAATFSWDVDYTYNTDGSAAEGYVSYIFDNATVSRDAFILACSKGTDAVTELLASGKAANDLTDSDGYADGLTLKTTYEANESADLYFVLFNSDDVAKADYVFVAQTETGTIGEKGQDATVNFLDQTGSKSAANWTKIESVPEPTSGLLLLLGVAGLALRRRRA